ncbi:hypothetical protein K491DRAFT_594799, partial [Lophiostoma macrostomum CBS 122681]
LCLTSKALRSMALPRLYRSISLRTWEGGQAGSRGFVKAVAAGAGPHLHFTRSLSFEDDPPPRNQLSLDPSRFDMEINSLPGAHTISETDNSMLLVLQKFPQYSLSKFE